MKILLTFLLIQLVNLECYKVEATHKYNPDWNDLDSRPLPKWYDKAKIGIFLHWGVYSVPSYGSEWFWSNWQGGNKDILQFMKNNYPPGFSYQDFAPMFTAEFFNSDEWAQLFQDAGAKYVVLTSKHHEGYTLFPSKRSFSWNALDVGPKRDLVGELADSVRKQGIKFGLYHSLYEWFNPIYEEDKATNFTTRHFVHSKLWPDLKQLVNDYQPSVIWADGDWEAQDSYWRSQNFLAWLYNESPVKDEVVVNDRWGIGTYGKHGDFYNFADRHNPGTLIKHKWENAFTIDKNSWGYRRTMTLDSIMTDDELLEQVVSTVSCGGNALIDVGPTKEGTIPLIFQERLLTLGKWLQINGEAIYDTTPWQYQKDADNDKVWYTRNASRDAFYAISLQWPPGNQLKIKDVTKLLVGKMIRSVELLGNNQTINWQIIHGVSIIYLPDKAQVESQNAWTLKFTLMR